MLCGKRRPAAYRSGIRSDERGSVAIMSGVIISLFTVISIATVDLGWVYLDKRRSQEILDIAAELAAGRLDDAGRVVREVLAVNGVANIQDVDIVLGHYAADAALSPGARFVADPHLPNALRVTLRKRADLFFARSLLPGGSMDITVVSIGAQRREAAFSIGSRLLRIEDGILNALLGSLLGGSVGLTAVDYRHLVDADVSLFGFLDALAVRTGATVATYDRLLASEVAIGDLVAAAGSAMDAGSSAYQLSAITKLGNATRDSAVTVDLSSLIDLGPLGGAAIGGAGDGLEASVSALSLLSAAATAANGDRQLTLNLGAGLPGLATLTVDLEVGERPASSPWLSIGSGDVTVRTAQVRAAMRLTIGGSGLLGGKRIDLPIVAEVASAEARLAGMECDAARQPTVSIEATPGIVSAWIGETVPFRLDSFSDAAAIRPATIVNALNLLTIKGQAHVEMSNVEPTALTFTPGEISEGHVETISTNDYTESLVDNLLDDLQLQVSLGPLSLLPVNLLKTQLISQLRPLAATLDDALGSILNIAGVNLGEADIWVNGARCGRSGLVG